jgi:Skp family chaperone for outer membrane proteins
MPATPVKSALLGLTALTVLIAQTAPAEAASAAPAASAPAPAALASPTPTTAPAATPAGPSFGPLIAGVCLISQETLIARTKTGQAATTRLREIAQQVQAGLNAEKVRLEARGKALEAKRATLTPLQLQAQGQAINQSAQALQAKAADRSGQIDATKTKAYNLVIQQAQPFITQAYAAHACGLLLSRETVVFGNMANDLTPEVAAALDAKAPPITFDLEPPRPAR